MTEDESNIDDIDRQIIRILQVDGRTPYSQIGRTVGLSDAAARQRVNRLTAQGYIKIVAVTDQIKTGPRNQSMLGVRVTTDARKVAAAIGTFDDAFYVVMTAGRYDLLVELVTRDRDGLVAVSNEIRMLPGVESVEIMPYLGITKETYDWEVG